MSIIIGIGLKIGAQSPTQGFSPGEAPSNLTVTATGSNLVLLWTRNSILEEGFAIERSTDGINYIQIVTVGSGIITYTDSAVTNGMLYYYRCRAYRGSVYSNYSNVDSDVASNTETLAYIARMDSEPTNTRKSLLAVLIKGLIDDGVWAVADVIRIHASHTQATGLLNIIGNYANASINGVLTFTVDRGFVPTAGYLSSNFNPGDGGVYHYQQNSAMQMAYYNITPSVSSQAMRNLANLVGASWTDINASALVAGNITTSSTTTRNSGLGLGGNSGYIWHRRLVAATMQGGINLNDSSTPVYASAPIINQEFNECINGTGRMACIYFGAALPTATLLTAFQNRMTTYLTAIGAN